MLPSHPRLPSGRPRRASKGHTVEHRAIIARCASSHHSPDRSSCTAHLTILVLALHSNRLLLRHVPVSRLHPVPFILQPFLHLLCNEDRTMLPPATPKRHCQVAFSLSNVVRQEKLQHVRGLVQE